MSDSNEIDDIVEQLRADSVPTSQNTQPVNSEEIKNLSDENVNDYIYKKTAELIESSLNAVQTLKDSVVRGNDPREISSLSQLINATSKAISTLNSINLQNKQNKSNLEIKKLEVASRNDMLSKLPQTTNVLIATRDEIMSKLFDKSPAPKKERLEVIDAEFQKND